jgi:excisionase family DNA binding protein
MTITETGPPPMAELPPLSDDRLYTAEEASPYVNVSARFLKRGAYADTIQHVRVGRFVRFNAQNIRDIVAGVPHRPRPRRNR